MPRHKPIIVGLGELLWDLLPTGRRLGGAPANFAYHANALGAGAGLVSAVGTDQPWADALAALTEAGLSKPVPAAAECQWHPRPLPRGQRVQNNQP